MTDLQDLITLSEVAKKIGMSTSKIYVEANSRYSNFPEPLRSLDNIKLYSWKEILKWKELNG